jgi:hypothetical protein
LNDRSTNSGLITLHRRPLPEFWQRLTLSPYCSSERTWSSRNRGGHSNFPERLDRALTLRRIKQPDLALFGQWGDPYQAAERRLRLTHRTIEILAKHGHPLMLITAFTMVLRDIDLIREVGEECYAAVAIKLPTLSPKKLHQHDPHGKTLKERLNVIDRIRRSGVQTGIIVWPHLPGDNNTSRAIESFYKLASDLNLDFLLVPFADGYFHRDWQNCYNHEISSAPGYAGSSLKFAPTRRNGRLCRKVLELAAEYNIRLRPRRFIPDDYRHENYWLAGRLADQAYQMRLEGRPFRDHLTAARRINDLSQDIRNIVINGGINSVLELPAIVLADVERLLHGAWVETKRPTDVSLTGTKP